MAAEQTYVSAQSDMINKYKTIQESIAASCQDYNKILECQNKLSLHLQHHNNESQNQSNTFAQVLMSLYTSILMGTMPAPLTQDIIDRLTPSTDMEIKENGTGAPGMEAKCSSTNHNGGNQNN